MENTNPSLQAETVIHAGWSKRFHAWMLATFTARYERLVVEHKQRLFADLHGTVLEIGPGTGSNLKYYPKDIHWIGIEPNPYMHRYLQKEAERLGLPVTLHLSEAERLEAEDNSVDAVVSTLVLCSVRDVTATLREIVRVLKPGGRFICIEHVAAHQGTWLRWIQQRIRPLWMQIADDCCPDRETGVAIKHAGFERVHCQHFRVAVPLVGPHIACVAVKKA
jgi:ubiquinone/menaquinone biosynthesis C-methylase UbiE